MSFPAVSVATCVSKAGRGSKRLDVENNITTTEVDVWFGLMQ